MRVTANGITRTRYITFRGDGQFTKWDFMSPAQMQGLANMPFLQSTEDGYVPGKCGACKHPLPTEAEFAKHFVIPDIRYLGLGYCPNKKN